MADGVKIFTIILAFVCGAPEIARAQEVFTWEDCLAQAKENNPELISAAEGIKLQRSEKDITASGLYPQFSADVDASTSKTSTTSSSGITTSATNDSYSYGISGSQLIFDGFKSINDLKAASENVKAAQQAYRFTSSEVRLNLRSAFINLLRAQELIRVAEEIVQIRRDNLVLITLQYQSGLEHRGALLTAEANVADADSELSQARRNVDFSQRRLSKEMGRKEFEPLSVEGGFIVNETVREKPDFEALVKTNPSILQAAAEKNSSLLGIRSAYGNFAPQISGTASANKKSPKWPPENDQWSVGLGLTLPLFEGGLKAAELSKAFAAYNQAVADERDIRDTAIVALEQAWAALQDAIETAEVRRKTLEASEERSKIAEAQYSTGFISFDNWIIIENDLVQAKKAYLEARANALLAEANWVQAKGETLEYVQ
ncbi:MAG: TolC family protein [Candidatus Omnitrophica bacterium]|nr:TolC family protein [Candidatus Omnitrophota bacterium]